ncbi:DUF1203 domain-containing protein [Luteimonas viscosa]|uniref:DUF1203 domain-containing protein n=1 Tax=Luteimonas viscosa TaxID=1132694 RepID=A0A5D4XSA8_9GAMM|nr:DUF1203 domain-containing protein [Luteimonas viscosa]TYT25842.1 DUF1203 domain-containing protein [Luteimonas viscosa]
MTFRLSAIDPADHEALFALDDEALQRLGARRCIADREHGFPCRVSLEDAKVGEEVLLLSYEHQPHPPYRASGPIFIRRGAIRRDLPPGVVPPYVTTRLVSMRAYDAVHMLVHAAVHPGDDVARELVHMFGNEAVAYVHLHNARYGCFFCVAERA